MISSLPHDVITPDAFQSGAFAFIEKPFELATLACEVRTTLAQRKA
jgi:FixJ family two-component response regulator